MNINLTKSVIAVPPLARNANLSPNVSANAALIRHLESGGVSTLMYGGNANFYNIAPSEYPAVLDMLLETCASDTWIIPAAGPDYGKLADQAKALRDRPFPTAMALPASGVFTTAGVKDGLRRFSGNFGRPIIAYLRSTGYLTPQAVAELVDEGTVIAIKYAIVRDNPSQDPFLEELVGLVDRSLIISGIGERPAITHWMEFGLRAFTSGSVSVAPRLSTALLNALKAGNLAEAARLREVFLDFETLRDTINPIRVLHDGVSLAGIADMGHALPLLSNLDQAQKDKVAPVALALAAENMAFGAARAA